jgi:hypothetical protein
MGIATSVVVDSKPPNPQTTYPGSNTWCRMICMRLLAATIITAAALTASACSSSANDGTKTTDDPDPATSPAAAAEKSARKDAESYAVQLEQVFASSVYPKNLAGVVGVATRLNLKLSQGNQIGSYSYDPDVVEFKLCVENTSGAWAVYDTRPMTVLKSGKTGGCP